MMRKPMSVKKMATDEVCAFSRGKTAENGSVSAQRSTWQGAKHLKIEGVFLIFEKKIFEIYINFACWWWFCCRSEKHFHIVLCVWICNNELHHVWIFVTPCLFYVLLQCDGRESIKYNFSSASSISLFLFLQFPSFLDSTRECRVCKSMIDLYT